MALTPDTGLWRGEGHQGRGQRQLGAVRAGPHALRGAGMTAKTSTSRSVNTTRARCRSLPEGLLGTHRPRGWVGREGQLKSMDKRQCRTSPVADTAGIPGGLLQPCAPGCSRRPKTRGWRTEHLTSTKYRGEQDLARCAGGPACPAQRQPSPRARRQAMVPDSGSGKQLTQRGGVGGDTTLTRTEHGWPKATL